MSKNNHGIDGDNHGSNNHGSGRHANDAASQQGELDFSPYIRWMIRRDLAAVLAIEGQSFSLPWSGEDFIRCLRQRNCIGMVAEDGRNSTLGFMIYELHKHRLRVVNFAVGEGYRGQGIGRAMIGKLIGKLSDRRHTISLEVGEWNLAAHLFFASQGFRATSVQRDFYDNSPDEAYRFEYRVHGWPVSTAAGPEAAGESEIKPAFRQVLTRHNRIARFLKQD